MNAVQQVGEDLWCVTAGSFPANSYIVRDGSPEGVVLIDVGLDPQAVQDALTTLHLRPSAVYCTHGHFDHIGGAAFFQRRYGIPVFLHHDDVKTAKSNNFLLMLLKSSERIEVPDCSLVTDRFEADIGDRTLRYSHAPGHTPGSCLISFGGYLFTGDTVYARSISLAKTAGEKPDQLRETILRYWDMLGEFTVYPGHGPSAPGSQVQAGNRALRAFLGLDPVDGIAVAANRQV